MFDCEMSKQDGLYVGIYSGNPNDADYERCVSTMTEFERTVRGQQEGIAVILVTDPGVPPVPACWRKRMADFNQNVQASKYLLAIVTPSSVIRGILTAINWLSPAKGDHHRVAHGTFAEARAWIEKHRGKRQPRLTELYDSVRARIPLRQTG